MSLIKSNAVQIGQSSTATQNFTLSVPSAPDGTIKLARGNSGATTQDVLSVDASGNIDSLVKSTGSTTSRSLANRFADVVNVKDFGAVGDWNGTTGTNDTAAIQAAITSANSSGKTLYWPIGTYLTTASISNFHNVKHIGNGIIKRGTDLFNISNSNGSTNRLYVSVTGNDNSDGLSFSEPFATLQKSADVLQNYVLTGEWEINLAAGNYSTSENKTATFGFNYWNPSLATSDAYKKDGILSNNYITIKGPDVGYDPITNPRPEPTAIFQGGSAAAVGIICNGVNIVFQNLKFREYNGSQSSAGISASRSKIKTLNVHTFNCYYGISSAQGSCEINGGSIYGNSTKTNTYGIRSIFQNYHAVGSQTATLVGQGPLISFCTQGALIQENSTGHFDYCSIEDNGEGLRITNSSRVNCSGSHFKRNNIGIRADYCSNFYRNNVNFYTGTSDKNNENTIIQTYSSDISLNQYSNSGIATDFITTNQIVTGTLTSTSVLSKILEGGFYSPNLSSIRKPEMIKLYAYGKQSGTAGTKQYKIRLGSTILASVSIPATVNGDWTCESIITFFSPTSQKAMFSYFAHNGDAIKVSVDDIGTEDMSTDKTLTFEVQLTNVADIITVNHAHIEVWG